MDSPRILPNEQELISKLLASNRVHSYVINNLRTSLTSIGFTHKFVDELTENLGSLEVDAFRAKHLDELEEKYRIGFFQKLVPGYFKEHILPELSSCSTVLDIGCGTGILAKILGEEAHFVSVVGIDLIESPEWECFRSSKVQFRIITESNLQSFLESFSPDAVLLTWVLHHMDLDEQIRYLRQIYGALSVGSVVVLLEDSYAESRAPEHGRDIAASFFAFSAEERHDIMSIYDWVANRVLTGQAMMKIPFTYRPIEQWAVICADIGYTIEVNRFIGFPNSRDINTPQSLLVIRK